MPEKLHKMLLCNGELWCSVVLKQLQVGLLSHSTHLLKKFEVIMAKEKILEKVRYVQWHKRNLSIQSQEEEQEDVPRSRRETITKN